VKRLPRISVPGGWSRLVAYPPGATTQTRITLVWTDDEPLRERSVWSDVALGLVIAAVLVGFVLVVVLP